MPSCDVTTAVHYTLIVELETESLHRDHFVKVAHILGNKCFIPRHLQQAIYILQRPF